MRHVFLAALMIGILPAMAQAGDHYYDRGERYHGNGHSNSFFGISLGFGSDNWFGGFSYSSGGYYPGYAYPRYYPAYRPVRYYAPVYYAPALPPAVIYPEPVAAPAPAAVQPGRSYYYAPADSYYAPTRSYYVEPKTYSAPSNRYFYGR